MIILIFRLAILMVLYLFLWQLVAVIWRDLHRSSPKDRAEARPRGQLVVVDGGSSPYKPGHVFSLLPETSMGRGPQCGIILNDGFVSTNHARLTLRDGMWWLNDLGSRNGTLLNGERVEEEIRLQPGDVIGIGQVKLKLRLEG